MKQLGADGNYYWYPGLANGGDDYSNPEPYNGQDGGPVSTPVNSAGDPYAGFADPGYNPANGVASPSGTSGGAAPVADYPTDAWRQAGGTGAPPWAVAQAQGIPYATWIAQQQAGQADAKQKADLALQLQQKQLAQGSASTGASIANAQLAAQSSAANLAEQKRQFDLGQTTPTAYQQAVIANDAAQRAASAATLDLQKQQLEVDKGKDLLTLGSRPDTLIKYLYAIRGQQTPQAIAGTTTNLPGFQNVVGQPNPGAGAGGASSSASPVLAPSPSTAIVALPVPMLPGTTGMQTSQPASSLQNNAANPNYQQNLQSLLGSGQDPALAEILKNAQSGSPAGQLGEGRVSTNFAAANPAPSLTQGVTGPTGTQQFVSGGPQSGLQLPNIATSVPTNLGTNQVRQSGQYTSLFDSNENVNALAKGGVIPEPVSGVGDISGQPYKFGEEGPEAVIPNDELGNMPSDMLERLMQASGKVDIHTDGPDGKKQKMSFVLKAPVKGPKPSPSKSVNSYAAGGTIGYDPSNVPTLGSQGAGFFNDPNLQTVVNRGYNSSPQTPLFPQIGIATGGGQSLIPSMQRLNSLLPSEKSLYSGALQDEFGAQPDDVYALSQSLAPGARNLTTPQYKA